MMVKVANESAGTLLYRERDGNIEVQLVHPVSDWTDYSPNPDTVLPGFAPSEDAFKKNYVNDIICF